MCGGRRGGKRVGGLNKASALPRLFPLLANTLCLERGFLLGWMVPRRNPPPHRQVGSSGGAEEGREEREGVEELRQTFRSSGGQWYCCSCTPCEGRRGERKEGRERSLRTDTRVCTDSRAHTCSGFPSLPRKKSSRVCEKRGGGGRGAQWEFRPSPPLLCNLL